MLLSMSTNLMLNNKSTLIDSIYINNSGGKILLDYLVNTIIEKDYQKGFTFYWIVGEITII